MSFVTPQIPQDALDNIAWLNQERRRRENEEAEVELRSKELTIRRCQVDLGIVNPKICKDIAEQVFRAEVQDRQQTAALNIYQREVERLRGGDGLPTSPPRILTSKAIQDTEDEVEIAQQTLNTQRDIRNARLRSYLNVCRTESTRDEGKATLEKLATELAEAFAKDPNYDPRGRPVHCGFDFTRIGKAEDYLTLHNRYYERGPASNLAPNFRNIKIKGKTLAIRALKNTHANEYAALMENPEWSKPEPGLVVPGVAPRRQPVLQRVRELAGDAGHGQGYALAVQGHGDDGQFYGIASYNRIVTTTPNDFFETVHMSPDKHRMVDFNFQLSCASLSMENAIEAGILMIEHARRYFGASLFLTQCSPLNSRYIDIMGALGLGRYQTIEAASYDRKLTAMVWKFDLCAWKAAEVELRFRGEWFINDDTMQEDPDRLKRPLKSEPREDFPNLAKVKTRATALEDPAAFENRQLPRQPVVRLFPHPMQGVQATEQTTWSSSESHTNESNPTGTIDSGESGTSSGLGHSESAQSQLTFDTFRTYSLPDSTSRSSDTTSQSGNGVFGLQSANFASSSTHSAAQNWDISEVVAALREEEASRAMPPPRLPIRPPVNEQEDIMESDLFSMAHYSDATSESLGIDSQSSVPDDPKGKRPAYAYSLSHPGPSMEQSQVRGQQVEQVAPEAWPLNNTGLETAPTPTSLHDKKGKRPASVSWEAQVNKRPSSSRPQTNDEDMHHAPPSGTGPANHQDQPELPQARKHHGDSAASVQTLPGCAAQNYGQSDTDHYDRSKLATGPMLSHSETVSPNLQSSMANVMPANESNLSPSPPASNPSRIDAREVSHSNSSEFLAAAAPASSPLPTQPLLRVHSQAAALPSHAACDTSLSSVHRHNSSVHDRIGPHSTATAAFSSVTTLSKSHTTSEVFRRPELPNDELQRVEHGATFPRDTRKGTKGTKPSDGQSNNTPYSSNFTIRSSSSSPPQDAHHHDEPQRSAVMGRDLVESRSCARSQNFTGPTNSEQYKQAVHSYVEFVEEQLSKQQAAVSQTHKVPAATGDPWPANRHQVSQSSAHVSAAQPEHRPHGAGRGRSVPGNPDSQVEASRSGRQSRGSRQADSKKSINKATKTGTENVETKPARHTSSSLGQPGPSNWTGSHGYHEEYNGYTTQNASTTQTSRVVSSQPDTAGYTPGISFAPTPCSQAAPSAQYGSSSSNAPSSGVYLMVDAQQAPVAQYESSSGVLSSTSYPMVDAQPAPIDNSHECSPMSWQMPQHNTSFPQISRQQAAYSTGWPQTDVHRDTSPQHASSEPPLSQVAHQHLSSLPAGRQHMRPRQPAVNNTQTEHDPPQQPYSQYPFQSRARLSDAPEDTAQSQGQSRNELRLRPWQL